MSVKFTIVADGSSTITEILPGTNTYVLAEYNFNMTLNETLTGLAAYVTIQLDGYMLNHREIFL